LSSSAADCSSLPFAGHRSILVDGGKVFFGEFGMVVSDNGGKSIAVNEVASTVLGNIQIDKAL
jgi:hypothetical protein